MVRFCKHNFQPPKNQQNLALAVNRQPWLPPGTRRASCHQREWYKRERTLLAKHRSRHAYTDAGFSVLTPSAALYRKSRALSEMREIILHRQMCTRTSYLTQSSRSVRKSIRHKKYKIVQVIIFNNFHESA